MTYPKGSNETSKLNEGEMIVVPKGVEHRPRAGEETWILLFEPIGIKHTGDITTEITKSRNSKGFDNLKKDANDGGGIATIARVNLEKETNKKVLSNNNNNNNNLEFKENN